MPPEFADYRFLVKTKRMIVPGVLDTLSDQGPIIQSALDEIAPAPSDNLASLDGGRWTVISHSASFYSGLLVITFLLGR
jgi:hypothetical protein